MCYRLFKCARKNVHLCKLDNDSWLNLLYGYASCALLFTCDDFNAAEHKMTKSKYFHCVLFCVFTLTFIMVPRNRQQRVNKMHALYFTDTYLNCKNNSNIHHCITGNVIGTRPRVRLLYFTELKYHKESEDTHNRTSISRRIFDDKFGEGSKEEQRRPAHLQAIGNYDLFVMRQY